jgi:two-component system, chemotaxis family, protein-glutamate methylesterase/glutaminase
MQRKSHYEAIVIGSSAGGINALIKVLSVLPPDFPLPIVIVQHLHPESGNHLSQILKSKSALIVKQADEKEFIRKGGVYLAPPNYHLLIEDDFSFSFSLDAPVNYSRPSIDVLFESAVYAYRQRLIGIILTGANHDGSQGLKKIKEQGGFTMVQDPKTAEADTMPRSAIAATQIDKILPLQEIGIYLLQLVNRKIS